MTIRPSSTVDASMRQDLNPQIRADENLRGAKGNQYLAGPGLIAAVNVALTLERPLLLTGEPGCGKTDFAFACAHFLAHSFKYIGKDRELLSCTVRSDTRAKDLLYAHDAVRRFGDAQFGGNDGQRHAQDSRRYIDLQPLGVALASSRRRVCLIDEIDKAPRDLPNDLLMELDKGLFKILEIPEDPLTSEDIRSHDIPLLHEMKRPRGVLAPLIIITSNVENQLPDAFLRRCIFWDIKFPDEQLPEILAEYFRNEPQYSPRFGAAAIRIFREIRSMSTLTKRPATAELLDWVAALIRVFHKDVLGRVFDFAGRIDRKERPLALSELPGLACLIKLRDDLQVLSGV